MAPTDQRILKVNASQIGTVECCAGDDGVDHLSALQVGACRDNRRGADYASPDAASLHLQPSKHGFTGAYHPQPHVPSVADCAELPCVPARKNPSKVSNTTHAQSPHVDECALVSPER